MMKNSIESTVQNTSEVFIDDPRLAMERAEILRALFRSESVE